MDTLFKSSEMSVQTLKRTKIKREYNNNRTFHGSLKYLFIISQFFTLFPLDGISDGNYQNTSFSWFSLRTIHSIFFTTSSLVSSLWTVFFLVHSRDPFEVSDMNDIFYYLGGGLTSVSFVILASNWKPLMKKFDFVEKFLLNYPRSKKLPTKMKILTLSLIFFAAAEHFTINCINLLKSFECEKDLSDIFERFFARITYIQFFRYIPYNFFIGLYLQIQNLYVAFTWTFIDIFLMNASIHFTDKLIQLKNQISLTIQERTQDPDVWTKLRRNYTDMLHLFEIFNKKLNFIILLSFATNIYFLLSQLFAWLRTHNLHNSSAVNHIYHLFSLSLLICRTAFVCYYGASIQEETTNIGNTLVMIPTYLYTEEVRRFIVEVKSSPMVLTGSNYFSITRGLMLKITGAIVSYELVIIQFTKDLKVGLRRQIC